MSQELNIVNLYYIICNYGNKDIYNVGDIYGRYLIEKIINNPVRQRYQGNNVFQLVGSIIRDSNSDSVILGSGILAKTDIIKCFKDCHIVRGKHTLNSLKKSQPQYDCSKIIMGDPGLTLSYFVNKKVNKTHIYGLLLHYIDCQFIKEYFSDECLNKIKVINIDNPNIDEFISQILSCEKIIISSLHGIVFSHSLGLTPYWIRLSKSKLPIDDIKYHDYFSIYDIDSNKLCNTITKKLEYSDVSSLTSAYIHDSVVDKIKSKIFDRIITVLLSYGYDVKKHYLNIIYNNDNGFCQIRNLLTQPTKFLINRIGGVEFNAVGDYLLNGYNTSSYKYKNMFKYCGYYDVDQNKSNYEQYVKLYLKSLQSSSLIMVANSNLESQLKYLTISNQYFISNANNKEDENVISMLSNIVKISYNILESFEYFDKFFNMLNNKKILIISPFEREIRDQLARKDTLFNFFQGFTYPNFSKVEYINTYLTTDGFTIPHRNWLKTFEEYKEKIKTKDFDICLLICGAYSYPISDFIYNEMHKSCIYIGGIGQLFFGIKGGRYNITYFNRFMNNNWIYPYTVVNKNSNGVPNNDGLMAYFNRK